MVSETIIPVVKEWGIYIGSALAISLVLIILLAVLFRALNIFPNDKKSRQILFSFLAKTIAALSIAASMYLYAQK